MQFVSGDEICFMKKMNAILVGMFIRVSEINILSEIYLPLVVEHVIHLVAFEKASIDHSGIAVDPSDPVVDFAFV